MIETENYNGLFLNEDAESNKLNQLNTYNKISIPFTDDNTNETNFEEVSPNEKLFIHGIIEEPQSKMLFSYNIDSNNKYFSIYEIIQRSNWRNITCPF